MARIPILHFGLVKGIFGIFSNFVYIIILTYDALKYQSIDGIIYILLRLDGRKECMIQLSTIDKATIRIFLVDSLYKVGRFVGLSKLNVVLQRLHLYG